MGGSFRMSSDERSSNALGDFFAFRLMIVPTLMRLIYCLGVVLITVQAAMIVTGTNMLQELDRQGVRGPGMQEFARNNKTEVTTQMVLLAIGWFAIGNLLWRAVCEFWVVLFSIHRCVEEVSSKVPEAPGVAKAP